jgi:limonene-1,2-epoxide hydrolase
MYRGTIGWERVAVYVFDPAKMTLAICSKATRGEKRAIAVLPRQCKGILAFEQGIVASIAQARPLSHQRRAASTPDESRKREK